MNYRPNTVADVKTRHPKKSYFEKSTGPVCRTMGTVLLKFKLLLVAIFTLFSFSLSAGDIALTFDDVPLHGNALMGGDEVTESIIKTLKQKKVDDALFFITSQNISNAKALHRLGRYTDGGFHLANHSHSHQSANKIEPAEYLADFFTSHLITKDLEGLLKFHRPPYLHYGLDEKTRKQIYEGLVEHGYQLGYVTVDNFDWYINSKAANEYSVGKKINFEKLKRLYIDVLWASVQFYDSVALKVLGRSPKHVLLLHENPLAAMFLGDLIDHIRAQGWRIISPQEAYADPISKMYSPGFQFTKQGRVAAIAHSKGMEKELLRHPSENTDYLDKKFIEYKVLEHP